MPNLLQAMKFENKTANILKKDSQLVENINKIIENANSLMSIMGNDDEIYKKTNNYVVKTSNIMRTEYWKEKGSLPKGFKKYHTLKGGVEDKYTVMDSLPKVEISKLRELADKFNMVIVPIEYTEINKLFEIQENKDELMRAFNYYEKLMNNDDTVNYDLYLLCPINYYSIWQQIKSNTNAEVYYPEYFETMFDTLNMMIPAQKNLYLTTKMNEENLKELSKSFDTNIKILDDRIGKVSKKLEKLEADTIEEFKRVNNRLNNVEEKQVELRIKQEQLERENEELKRSNLNTYKDINFSYENIDPILFAVPEKTNVATCENINGIVGLCWGADIDQMIFDMKNITITHKNLNKINPLNLLSKAINNVPIGKNRGETIDYLRKHIRVALNELKSTDNHYWATDFSISKNGCIKFIIEKVGKDITRIKIKRTSLWEEESLINNISLRNINLKEHGVDCIAEKLINAIDNKTMRYILNID